MKITDENPKSERLTHQQAEHRGTRWPLITFCCLLAAGLAVGAGVEFSRIRQSTFVNLPLPAQGLKFHDGLVSVNFGEGTPLPHLAWDGEFPRAELIDTRTSEVLAPSLVTEESLSLNTHGVFWTAKTGCHAVLTQATYDEHGDALAVRFECRPSPLLFNILLLLSICAACGAVAVGQWRRILAASREDLPRVCFGEFRVTCFVLLSLIAGFAFYPGHPMVHVTGDPSNINSFAAAYSHPQIFERDRLLGEPSNYFWYTPGYVKFVQFFGTIGLHFETNRTLLAFVSTLLGLFGFYRLFQATSGSETYAFFAALCAWYLKCHFPPNEDWGAGIVLPRSVYASLLPWVLCLAIKWRVRPMMWPVAAAASGLLFYIHPVSSPALTGAVLTGFVVAGPGIWWRRLGWGVLSAIVAIMVMLPYTLTYAQKYTQTVAADPQTIAQAVEYAKERFDPGFLDLGVFSQQLAEFLLVNVRYWPGILAFSSLMIFRWRSLPVRALAGMSLGWGIVTFLIPAVDLTVAGHLDRMPFQMDLVRNLRYADVLLLATLGLAFREFHQTWRPDWVWEFTGPSAAVPFVHRIQTPRMLVSLCGLLFVSYFGSFVHNTSTIGEMVNVNANILRGRPPKGVASDNIELLRVVQALRQPAELVRGPVQMRQAYVPLAYTNKDLAILPYANPVATVDAWTRLHKAMPHLTWPVAEADITAASEFLEADWLILDREDASPALLRSKWIRFQNQAFLVLHTPQRPSLYQDQPHSKTIHYAGNERPKN